jgi:uncharacterized protein DUF4259
MGAWGAGSFENDSALDWAGMAQSLDDVRAPFEALKSADYVDVDLASEVIAAAETVAMLMGRRSKDFPADLAERLGSAGEPDDALYHAAREAVMKVARNSELAELWQEGVEEGGANEWNGAITGLIERLNPDVDGDAWSPQEVEHRGGQAQSCAFCDRPVESDELFLMTLFDCSSRSSGDRSLWLHLECLNKRLHHKHAVLNIKFDPERMPKLD